MKKLIVILLLIGLLVKVNFYAEATKNISVSELISPGNGENLNVNAQGTKINFKIVLYNFGNENIISSDQVVLAWGYYKNGGFIPEEEFPLQINLAAGQYMNFEQVFTIKWNSTLPSQILIGAKVNEPTCFFYGKVCIFNFLTVIENPFNQPLKLEINGKSIKINCDELMYSENSTIAIYGLSGKVITENVHINKGVFTFHENLDKGVYFLLFRNKNKEWIKKIWID